MANPQYAMAMGRYPGAPMPYGGAMQHPGQMPQHMQVPGPPPPQQQQQHGGRGVAHHELSS